MNLIDFVIIGVLALFMLSGLHKGFLYTAISTVCCLLCLLLAYAVSPLISKKVIANEKIFNNMLYYTEGSEYIYDVEYSKMPITQLSNAELEEIYNRSDVAYPMGDRIRVNIEEEAFAESGIITLGDYFNHTMVRVTINILAFLSVYVVLRLITAIALGLANYIKAFPWLKKFDIPISLGCGLIRGIMSLFIVFMLTPIVLTVLPFEVIENLFEESLFAAFFYHSNLLFSFIPGT